MRAHLVVLAMVVVGLQLAAPRAEAARHLASGDGRSSIGVTLGDPFGLTFKRYLSDGDAFDVNLALAYGPGLRLSADYLLQLDLLSERSKADLNAYIGVGPMIGFFTGPCYFDYGVNRCNDYNNGVYVGGRVPIGLEAVFHEAPIAVGLEVAPGLAFAPGRVGYLLDVLLAVRYVF